MTWWMVLLGVVMLAPALFLVIGTYVAWLIRAIAVLDEDLRKEMASDDEALGVIFWVFHFVVLTGTGISLLVAGFGV